MCVHLPIRELFLIDHVLMIKPYTLHDWTRDIQLAQAHGL